MQIIIMTICLMSPLTRAGFTKCCPAGQVLNLHTKKCIDDNSEPFNGISVDVEYTSENKSETVEEELVYAEVPTTEQYQCTQSLRYQFLLTIAKYYSKYYIVDLHQPKYFSASEACLDHALDTKTSDISLVAQACLNCTKEEPCVNNCCPDGQISRDAKCVDDSTFLEILSKKKHQKVSIGIHCDRWVVYPQYLWDFNAKGEMYVDGTIRNASEYCVEQEPGNKSSLLLCPMEEAPLVYTHVIKIVFMCLSMLSIIVIVVFHVMIEDLWMNRFTKLKIPLYVCLFISFLIIVITSLIDFTNATGCVAWALALQYFSLAIFFWLTSMSLDIWLGFRIIANPLQNVENASARLKSRMKFSFVFSLGSPLVICIVTGTLQLWGGPGNSYIHPRIGVSCMLGQYLPQFVYFHVFILALLCVNGIFYFLVLCNFTCGIWSQCRCSRWIEMPNITNSIQDRNQLQNLRIIVELVFLMGINWISEIVSFFVGWQFKENWDHPMIVFINSINWLIGVFILLLFCPKLTNRNLVRKLFLKEEEDLAITC